jgi:hypothetical protein
MRFPRDVPLKTGPLCTFRFSTYLVEYNNRKAARSLQHQTLSHVPSVRVEFLCVHRVLYLHRAPDLVAGVHRPTDL